MQIVDKLELFNTLALVVKEGAVTEYIPISNLDTPWGETNLDSMDAIMMNVYLSEVFGVAEETSKQFMFTTPKELLDLVYEHKTITPNSIEEVLQVVL